MKIGLDGAYTLRTGSSGRRNYSLDVIKLLATDYPQYSLSVYTPKISRKTRLDLIDRLHNAEYRLPAPSGFTGRLWQLFGITNCLLPDKIDVYHGLNGELPLNIAASHVPSVVTIGYTGSLPSVAGVFDIAGRLRRYVMTMSCRNATIVIAPSEEVKSDLMRLSGIEDDRIEVIPPAALTARSLVGVYEKAIEVFRTTSSAL